MKLPRQILMILAATVLASGVPLLAQQPAQESAAVRQVLNRIVAQEKQLVKSFGTYSPRVETYIQEIHTDKTGASEITGDDYALGRVNIKKGVVESSFLPPETGNKILRSLLIYRPILDLFSFQIQPTGFASPVFVDSENFDLQHYQFEFVGRKFLGEVRCLVFNVRPRSHTGAKGLFEGRIWVEDENYHIVRFNGDYTSHSSFIFHFDSWRENLQPGVWLPVYVYSEESDLRKYGVPHLGFKAQTRLWGYALKATTPEEELTQVLVDSKAPIQDSSETSQDPSPLQSVRDWRRQAEDNILERLQKGGLLAPPGPVDKVLETVVNNLVVTNHLDNLPPIRCRVLLTYPLESLTIGDTIVVSRGLVDVLPDEASLGMILAHELAHIALGDTVDTKYAFYDRMMISDEELLKKFDLARTQQDEEAADKKALQILENSPYKDRLGKAGLFLRALAETAPEIPNLFGSHFGNRLIDRHQQLRMAQLMQNAPKLEKNSLDQIAALPLGARVKVDSWNDDIALLKNKPVSLASPKDKMPFEITPLMPYLTRAKADPREQAQR
jgi:Peptidase family M48